MPTISRVCSHSAPLTEMNESAPTRGHRGARPRMQRLQALSSPRSPLLPLPRRLPVAKSTGAPWMVQAVDAKVLSSKSLLGEKQGTNHACGAASRKRQAGGFGPKGQQGCCNRYRFAHPSQACEGQIKVFAVGVCVVARVGTGVGVGAGLVGVGEAGDGVGGGPAAGGGVVPAGAVFGVAGGGVE